MSAYASIAVEKWKCLFRIVTYAFVTVVGIDKGEVYLAIEATVPFFTITKNFTVWQIDRVYRGVLRGILIKMPCSASLKCPYFQNCLRLYLLNKSTEDELLNDIRRTIQCRSRHQFYGVGVIRRLFREHFCKEDAGNRQMHVQTGDPTSRRQL